MTNLISATTGNDALNSIDGSGSAPANKAAYISAHSASPSTNGANELSGGGYARQAVTWNAASGNAKTNSTSGTIPNAGSTAVTHLAAQSAVTAGTYGIGIVLTSSVTAASITYAAGALSLGDL